MTHPRSLTTNIFDASLGELRDCMSNWGEPPYRAHQIWHALYRTLAVSFDDISNLPQGLRRRLSGHFRLGSLQQEETLSSADGRSRKALFQVANDGQIEAVLMRYRDRCTACISTQVGCAIGCVFCATGHMGLERNLSPGEIVEQALWFARELRSEGKRLTNIVLMGMGEPFHNYEATVSALDNITDTDGFDLGARKITVSTVGLVPMIIRFANEKRREKLAVSLHAATDEVRSSMVPINRRYPLSELIPACRHYLAIAHRRITFEWALVRGVNDTPEQARALVKLVEGMLCHINIIPLNPTQDYQQEPPTRDEATAFKNILDRSGVSCTIRARRGIDIAAGCGQLKRRTESLITDSPEMRNML